MGLTLIRQFSERTIDGLRQLHSFPDHDLVRELRFYQSDNINLAISEALMETFPKLTVLQLIDGLAFGMFELCEWNTMYSPFSEPHYLGQLELIANKRTTTVDCYFQQISPSPRS